MPTDAELKGFRIEDFVAEFLAAQTESSVTYEPREDSFLMLEALAELNLRGLKVLDVGTGSGILAAYCARRGADVTASDIDASAIRNLRLVANRLGITLKLVVCDLFSKIKDQFHIVIFNPPYLPSQRTEDRTTDGGRHGTRIIRRFLDQLGQRLTENGFGMLLVSSLNHPGNLGKNHDELRFETVRHRPFFFESLYVMRVEQKNPCPRTRSSHLHPAEERVRTRGPAMRPRSGR